MDDPLSPHKTGLHSVKLIVSHADKLVRISDASVVQDCPECGGRHTHKKLSTFATNGGSTGQGVAASSCGGGGRFS